MAIVLHICTQTNNTYIRTQRASLRCAGRKGFVEAKEPTKRHCSKRMKNGSFSVANDTEQETLNRYSYMCNLDLGVGAVRSLHAIGEKFHGAESSFFPAYVCPRCQLCPIITAVSDQ